MGKRELLIASAFVILAVLAYHLTAPPAKPGERGFSFSRMFSGIQREMRSNAASATTTRDGTVAIRSGVTELRLAASRYTSLTVMGERRDDVAYQIQVEATGPDDATAKANADGTVLKDDDLGAAQRLDLKFVEGNQHTARLTLHVPKQLLVSLEGSGHVVVSDLRAVELRNIAGDVTITNVTERLGGSHRSGELVVTKAGLVDLALSASHARFSEVDGRLTVNGRNGDCTITKSRGTVEAMMSNVEFSVSEPAGPVHVSGELGTLHVTSPATEVTVDVRRMEVSLSLTAAVAASVITTGEALKLSIAGPLGLSIDAVATEGGTIRASDFGLEATRQDRESRLAAPLGAGGPRVVLRNTSADIVIGLRK